MKLINTITFIVASWMAVFTNGYLYNPYNQFNRYSYPFYNNLAPVVNYYPQAHSQFPNIYANQYPNQVLTSYPRPVDPPIFNVVAEEPYAIQNKFTVVPLVAIANEDFNIVTNALIVQINRGKTTMRVKSEDDTLIQCTPAVKILLDKPLSIFSLKRDIVFPSNFDIVYMGFKISLQVGAVLAAIPRDQYISPETPALVHAVYAVPTTPFLIDVADQDQQDDDTKTMHDETQSVTVENNEFKQKPTSPKNVTIVEFPEAEAEPTFQVDEEDEELVNRNPPEPVIPAGIVQSTQPFISTQEFTNSKESPVLTHLREQAAKDRLKNQANRHLVIQN